ncbi:hypothetical protein RhiirC2_792854 [Rhizophagus irregularis]|uniref:Uncharacterized protein n=1 Tax=Rhizophagus irregularis TaxID=588596 RepID=A0A2N1MGR3_9GLOM|nr:hypothetical protein RhiirC2_792854 [Rhizophagus irregularis]
MSLYKKLSKINPSSPSPDYITKRQQTVEDTFDDTKRQRTVDDTVDDISGSTCLIIIISFMTFIYAYDSAPEYAKLYFFVVFFYQLLYSMSTSHTKKPT